MMDGDDDELLGAASSAPGAIEQWGRGPDDAAALASTTSTSGLRRTLTEARRPRAQQPVRARRPADTGYDDDGYDDGYELALTASNVDRKTLPREIPWGALIDITNHAVDPPSHRAPWKAGRRGTFSGTGFFIGDRMIITNHHVVRGQTSLRLKRNGQAGNFSGKVLCRSMLCDLALLTVEDETFWEGLPEVQFQESVPDLDDTVVVVGYPGSSGPGAKSVTLTRGVVSNVQLYDLSLHGNQPGQLTVQIDAAINSGNSGGPVFNSDTCEVVGVAFASQAEGRGGGGKVIPVPVLENFLKMWRKKGAEEFGLLPQPGFGIDLLINPAFRRSCFGGVLPRHRNGCLINSVSETGCAAGKLQVGDILMAIDGTPVSEDGDVVLRGQELIDLEYLFTKKLIGDTVLVTVLRAQEAAAEATETAAGVELSFAAAQRPREEVTVELTLAPNPTGYPRGVQFHYHYVVLGGLVFTSAVFPEWVSEAMSDRDRRSERYVELADVLAHDINVTYDQYRKQLVDKVNGVAVRDLRHFASLVSDLGDGDLTLDFKAPRVTKVESPHDWRLAPDGSRTFVVFDCQELKETEAEILEADKVPSWCTPSLLGTEPEPKPEPEPEPEPGPEPEPEASA